MEELPIRMQCAKAYDEYLGCRARGGAEDVKIDNPIMRDYLGDINSLESVEMYLLGKLKGRERRI